MLITKNTKPLLKELIRHVKSSGASELRIASDAHPTCVVDGVLLTAFGAPLSAATVRSLHIECCTEAQRTELFYANAADYNLDSATLGNFRCLFSTRGETATLKLFQEQSVEYAIPASGTKLPNLSEEATPNSADDDKLNQST